MIKEKIKIKNNKSNKKMKSNRNIKSLLDYYEQIEKKLLRFRTN